MEPRTATVSSLTIICPSCDAKTPFRRSDDESGLDSTTWACYACGHAWNGAPLKVYNTGRPTWAVGQGESTESPPPRAAA